MHRLYAKSLPFNIRDLSIHGFWYPPGSWNQYPADTEGNCIEGTNVRGKLVFLEYFSMRHITFEIKNNDTSNITSEKAVIRVHDIRKLTV